MKIQWSILDAIKDLKFANDITYVLAVETGGTIPAVVLSQHLGVQTIYCRASHPEGNGGAKYGFDSVQDLIDSVSPGSHVLIVDDVADSGKTLQELCNRLNAAHIQTTTLVVAQFEHSNFTPDYALCKVDSKEYIYMPWEREYAK